MFIPYPVNEAPQADRAAVSPVLTKADGSSRNETLEDTASGGITTDTLPAESGQTVGNWTMR